MLPGYDILAVSIATVLRKSEFVRLESGVKTDKE